MAAPPSRLLRRSARGPDGLIRGIPA